jgi:hypothetical protein
MYVSLDSRIRILIYLVNVYDSCKNVNWTVWVRPRPWCAGWKVNSNVSAKKLCQQNLECHLFVKKVYPMINQKSYRFLFSSLAPSIDSWYRAPATRKNNNVNILFSKNNAHSSGKSKNNTFYFIIIEKIHIITNKNSLPFHKALYLSYCMWE